MRQDDPKIPNPTGMRASPARRQSAITTADIARHVGVSPATVSHVLNGRATALRIRPETQQRVLKAVAELGYRPNTSARAIRTGRFETIALFQSFHNVFLPPGLIQGVTEVMEASGRHLVMAMLPDEAFNDNAYLPKAMRELLADGLLINALVGIPDSFLEAVAAYHVPAIWINVRLAGDCIHPDDLSGGRIATEYLLSLGHERIAFTIAGHFLPRRPGVHYSIYDRRTGYAQAMQSAGRTPQIWEISGLPGDIESLRRDTRVAEAVALLQSPDRPTAIFAYEIETALPLLLAAAEAGLRVPEDLSLVMCHSYLDNAPGRAITTVLHDMRIVGGEAVRMLETKMRNPEEVLAPRPMPVYLVEGATCAPPQRTGMV
jgi:DNA-binding LacI/PurR family transcriptional regulator